MDLLDIDMAIIMVVSMQMGFFSCRVTLKSGLSHVMDNNTIRNFGYFLFCFGL